VWNTRSLDQGLNAARAPNLDPVGAVGAVGEAAQK